MGSDDQLVGIVSYPAAWQPDAGLPAAAAPGSRPAPACIILNAGVLHRVGPHRLHVVLARRIAAAGLASMRLDLGGIGDSIASSDAATFRESAVADTRVAMTALTHTLGAQRFILFGVCSGADNSLATALADDRVAGIVLVDPHTYPTLRSKLRYLRARVAERGGVRDTVGWGLTVAQRWVRETADRLAHPADFGRSSGGRERPPIRTFRTQLAALADRGVRVLAIYSGIHGAGYNVNDQLFELFPELRGRIDQMYFAGANHTFTELGVQADLIDAVTGWITKRFG
jgi:hypothetical protein